MAQNSKNHPMFAFSYLGNARMWPCMQITQKTMHVCFSIVENASKHANKPATGVSHSFNHRGTEPKNTRVHNLPVQDMKNDGHASKQIKPLPSKRTSFQTPLGGKTKPFIIWKNKALDLGHLSWNQCPKAFTKLNFNTSTQDLDPLLDLGLKPQSPQFIHYVKQSLDVILFFLFNEYNIFIYLF